MLYLTSLSMGIKEIALGNIKEDDVVAIISPTTFGCCEEAIAVLTPMYWNKNPEESAEICRRIWVKVIQPKIIYGDTHIPYMGEYIYHSLEEMEKKFDEIGLNHNVARELYESGYLK